MSNSESTKTKKTKQKTKRKSLKVLKVAIITMLCIGIIGGATGIGIIMAVIKDVPKIDYTKVATSLNENSVILDEDGQLIEKIQAVEFRTIVDISQIPEHVQNAFIAIEDERFRTHNGFDLKRIFGALWADIKARKVVQGASTITQQLVKNLYLFDEVDRDNLVNDVKRKIREMYLAIEMDKNLSKDQILNAYLNTVNLGRGAYGVQAAAELYFDKDVSELTLVETAMLAAVPKSPTAYPPYILLKPEDVTEKHVILGSVNVLGANYTAVVNTENIKRRKTVLITMLKNGFITREQYDEALSQDPAQIIKITKKINENIETSYFNDYVKDQVTKDLMKEKGYTKKQASNLIQKGGLKIYSTMDIGMQSNLEGIYDQFADLILKATHKNKNAIRGAVLVNRTLANNNIVDSKNKIIYYDQAQLYNENFELIIDKGDYSIDNAGNLIITSPKINYRNFDTAAHYIVDSDKNLLTFSAGYMQNLEWSPSQDTPAINILKSDRENKRIIVSNRFLNFHDDYYRIDANGKLLLNPNYLFINKAGIVQPQSSTIIMDYRTGKIKALVGGRDIKGQRLYNRATSPRQPGSSMKPLSVYLPALDNGLTAASTMDDIPYYTASGKRWPANWYGTRTAAKNDNYKGINTLRKSVQQSINVNAVKFLEYIGIPTSMKYLEKLHLIDSDNPSNDTFITAAEAQKNGTGVFDENFSALALGGMSRGISPLRMTAGYGAIANDGEYIEPIAYTKVLDRDGKVLLEKTPSRNLVTSPQVAYVMSDILESVISQGIGKTAEIYPRNTTIPVAGKTGTTQNKSDAWFVGYTPYYVSATWIGSDSPAIRLSEGSKLAASLWRIVMKEVHKDMPAKGFDRPSGLTTVAVCRDSGLLPSDLCKRAMGGSTVYNEIFVKGTEPKEKCEIHVEIPIDTTTNKLATLLTPPEFIEKKVVIKRDPPYDPEEHDGFMPSDYQFSYDAFMPDDGVLLPNDEVLDPNAIPVVPDSIKPENPTQNNPAPSEPPAWLFGPSDNDESEDDYYESSENIDIEN